MDDANKKIVISFYFVHTCSAKIILFYFFYLFCEYHFILRLYLFCVAAVLLSCCFRAIEDEQPPPSAQQWQYHLQANIQMIVWSSNQFCCCCIYLDLDQGWATLVTWALLSGMWARPRKRDPPPFNVSVSSILFVNNRLFNVTLMCFWCHMATNKVVSAALHTPQSQGPKIQTPHHKFWLACGRILSLILPFGTQTEKGCLPLT